VVAVCLINNEAPSATTLMGLEPSTWGPHPVAPEAAVEMDHSETVEMEHQMAPETMEMEALPASRAEAVKDYTADKAQQKDFDDGLLGAWSTVFILDKKKAAKKAKKVMVPPVKMHKSHGGHLFRSWLHKAGVKTPKGHPSQTSSSLNEAAAARHFQVKTATAVSNAKMARSERKKKWDEYVSDKEARMRDITKESRKKAKKELRVKKDIKQEKVHKKAVIAQAKKKAEEKKKLKNKPTRKERELKLCLKDAGADKTARKECQGVVLAASLLGAMEEVHDESGWETSKIMV